MSFEFFNSLKKDIFYSEEELYEDLEEYSLVEDVQNDSLLNFYAKAGFLRGEKEEKIINLFMDAYDEDPISSMKLLFYVRDKEKGLGERRVFRIILNHLGRINSSYLAANINLIPIYGRWDDLYSLFDTNLQGRAISLIRKQIGIDLKSENPSTLSKWLKSENSSSEESKELAKKTRLALDLTSKEYRVLLSHLRKRIKPVETIISRGNWNKVKYGELSSGAMHKYSKAFFKHDKERYMDYLDILKSQKIKKDEVLSFGHIYPYNIVKSIIEDSSNEENYYREMWEKVLSNFNCKYGDTIVCLGMSEKSINKLYKPSIFYGGIGTALYLLDKNRGKYKDYIITMNPKPNLVKIRTEVLGERIEEITKKSVTDEVNVESVLDIVLFAAIKNSINQNSIPNRILFILEDKCKISFSEERHSNHKDYFFDDKDYNRIKEKWDKSGYRIPDLCFWRIDGYKENSKVIVDSNGFQYAFGYSNEIFKFIIKGENLSSTSLVDEVLSNIRYSKICSDI
ncbi:DUF2828 family protein [Clostridium sp. HBUAS56017]|uniref:DUF2828 family protein n=1 Tax=Clostridium sp. HBUAS56017 TaxID=2571128 RepID=UPI0011778929|nr:DUF2828 family protein [Clostridium sp. HBUAS56017]